MASNSLREKWEHDIPSQILKTIFGLHVSIILDPNIEANWACVGKCSVK